MADLSAVTVSASSAKTASGASSAINVPRSSTALAVLADVTAVAGVTPSMTLSVEWSHNGITFAAHDPVDAFTALVAAGAKVKRFDVKGEWFRLVWTLTGTTPSFTFSSTAYGV